MKTIQFDYNDKHYTLEFNRQTAAELENMGFELAEVQRKPNIMIPMLFRAAFAVHHRNIANSEVNELYEALDDKQELVTALVDLYAYPTNTLFDSGKVNWKKI